MTFLPLHQYASVPLAASPEQVCARLLADPHGLVSQATADGLTAMGPHIHRFGFRISELPTTTASPIGSEAFGSVEVVWAGTEDATGWPALTGRLVVAAAGPTGSRLMLFSRRSSDAELVTSRLDRLHRQRIVHLSIQRFLQDLGRHLDDPNRRPATAHPAPFDRAPMFVHHLQAFDGEPGAVHDHLITDLQGLAERATSAALASARKTLHAGRFRAPAAPTIETRSAPAGEPASAWIRWRGDEEATGWPQIEFALLVEARPAGSRLALLSTREPGYDLSRQRIDKRQRDEILRTAGPALTAALCDELTGPASLPQPSERHDLVSARS